MLATYTTLMKISAKQKETLEYTLPSNQGLSSEKQHILFVDLWWWFFFPSLNIIFLACTPSANSSNPWNILFSENVSHWQSHLTVHVLKKINWTFFPKIHIWVLVSSLFMCCTVAVRPHSQNSEHPWLPLTEIPGG